MAERQRGGDEGDNERDIRGEQKKIADKQKFYNDLLRK